jgi:hypothetical protein
VDFRESHWRPKNRSSTCKKWALFSLLILTALFAGCTERNTADQRLRLLFSISPSVPLDDKSISSAVLNVIPLGTSESQVERKLRAIGVGEATISAYYPPSKHDAGLIRIEYDSTTWGLVKKSYQISLTFDSRERLSGVSAGSTLTGL